MGRLYNNWCIQEGLDNHFETGKLTYDQMMKYIIEHIPSNQWDKLLK